MLKIKNLKVIRDKKLILKGVNLEVKPGEIHAIMGPNGSGKSTLGLALAGYPDITIDAGEALLNGKNLFEHEPTERALLGLFLAFQYPIEIAGVPYIDFLRLAYNSTQKAKNSEFKELSPFRFTKFIEEKMDRFKMDKSFLKRNLNEGFSGGEKKKSEILQMAVLEPKFAILDETDSGLDVSALKIVANGAKTLANELGIGLIVITHYKRLLDYLEPKFVHVFIDGMIVDSGGMEICEFIDKNGYERYLK